MTGSRPRPLYLKLLFTFRARHDEDDGLRPRAASAHGVEREPYARVPPQEAIQRAHLLVRADALHVVSAPAPLELDELVEVQARTYNKPLAEPLEHVERALVEVVVDIHGPGSGRSRHRRGRARETKKKQNPRLISVGAAAQGRAHSTLR